MLSWLLLSILLSVASVIPGDFINITLSTACSLALYNHQACQQELDQMHCPGRDRPKRAILLLVHEKRVDELKVSVVSLFRNFLDAFRHPVYLFHENVDEAAARLMLRAHLAPPQLCLVRFVRIRFQFPPGFDPDEVLRTKHILFRWAWPGYHHMCAFWWKHVFERPEVRSLQYYMRLDTDSELTAPLSYNIFDEFERRGWQYGYRSRDVEGGRVVKNLWKTYLDYLERMGLPRPPTLHIPKPQWMKTAGVPAYYNNFEILRVPTITERPDIQHFINAIYNTTGIYLYRWGDAPLRFLLIHQFMDVAREVHFCCDVAYSHKGLPAPTCGEGDTLRTVPKPIRRGHR